jgi:hypothetical protein
MLKKITMKYSEEVANNLLYRSADDDDVYLNELQTGGVKKSILYM